VLAVFFGARFVEGRQHTPSRRHIVLIVPTIPYVPCANYLPFVTICCMHNILFDAGKSKFLVILFHTDDNFYIVICMHVAFTLTGI
jgi:hypothetical protein